MEKVLLGIALAITALTANAEINVGTPTTYSGLHWTVTGVPPTTSCTNIPDINLDLTGVSSSGVYTATGYMTCESSAGRFSIAGIGSVLNTITGLSVNVTFNDVRLFCVLPLSTMSNSYCSLINVATGIAVTNSMALTLAP